MPRVIAPKCPNCQAPMPVAPDAQVVECEYCGTQAKLQHTKHLMGKTTIMAHLMDQHGAVLRAARAEHAQKSIKLWVLVFPLVLMLGIGGLVWFIVNKVTDTVTSSFSTSTSTSSSVTTSTSVTTRFGSNDGGRIDLRAGVLPMVANVDGDPAPEVVAWVRSRGGGGTSEHLAAFDPSTGKRLWLSDAIDEGFKDRAAVVDALVVVATSKGKVLGFDAADGKRVWEASLGEKVQSMCQSSKQSALVTTRDRKRHVIAPESGMVRSAEDSERCMPTWTDRDFAGRSIKHRRRSLGDRANIAPKGMKLDAALAAEDGKLVVGLGHKKPGTRVPMLSIHRCKSIDGSKGFHRGTVEHRCHGAEEVWTGAVPPDDPLSAREGAPRVAAIGTAEVFVGYHRDNPRVVAFDAGTGERLWEWQDDPKAIGARMLSYVLPLGDSTLIGLHDEATLVDARSGKVISSW